jgi:tetratricopeptide (TPR) repeat protein
MKAYRNEQLGFEIEVPDDWSLPVGGALNDIRCRPDEAIDFAISPQLPELLPDYVEREFTRYARGKGYTNLEFGRMSVGGKEHVWARYHRGHGEWTKKYMLAFGGNQYVITTTGANQTTFAQREKVWDAMVRSFRLSEWRERDILTLKEHRRETAGHLYERAYEAVAEGRYSEARALLERCLSDDPNHVLAHKELAVVLKKMGDIRGALPHRREVKRLDPSDTVNRFNLADLLASLGARDEALTEVEELLAMESYNPTFLELRRALMGSSLTYPQHYSEEFREQAGKRGNLKLINSIIPDSPHLTHLLLLYQWEEDLPDEEARNLALRAIAFVCCAIYDVAISAGLFCQPSPIPNGRRPAWILEGEKSPVSLILSDIDESAGTCQMTIGAMLTAVREPPSDRTRWEKLEAAFRTRLSYITV